MSSVLVRSRLVNSVSLALIALVGAATASGQVTLIASANPADAAPQIQTVKVTGSGFPTSGTICNTCVSVTITPPPGNGQPVLTNSTFVASLGGTVRQISFIIPPALLAAQPLINCQVTVSGETSTNVAYSSTNYATLQVDPPASVLSASPGAGQVGTPVSLNIVGFYTHWATAIPAVTLTGPGGSPVIPGTAVHVTNNTHLSANFAIPANATPGAYQIQVSEGPEVATLAGGFLVSVNPSLSLSSILPNSGAAGSCLDVVVNGNGTSWAQNVTVAILGDGVDINGAETGFPTVSSTTQLTLPVCIDPLAPLGSRTLTIATGGEFEVAPGAFTITANGSTLQSIAPTTGPQGTNQTLTLTGVGTHWVQGGTTVSFGGGITVGNTVVNSPTSLTVNISVGPGVPVGAYSVTVTTNGEVVSLPSAFAVTLATPFLSGEAPLVGTQGQQNLVVNVTGTLTSFLTGAFTANFGSDITVKSATPSSNTQAAITISISNTAITGSRTVTITSDLTNFPFTFTVNKSGASITNVTPNSGFQGATVSLQVTGSGTHWAQGLTFASLGSLINVNSVTVNSPTSAIVNITIAPTAGTGNYGLTMSTNGEIETDPNAFTVLPYTPSLTLMPSSGMIGSSPATPNVVQVNLIGNLTHFANAASAGPTQLNIDGEGVTLQGFQVLGPTSATAQFVISSTAPASPSDPCNNTYGGNRTVTMTTPLTSGSEIVNAGFCVTSTPATLISINPYHSAEPVNNLSVTITGEYTHFVQGTTTISFGPNITVVPNSIQVQSSTVVTCQIDIPANTPIGWLPVFVNTGAEQLTIGFSIDAPATASLVSVSPSSGVQGQSLTVNITGNLTNFTQGETEAILGQGVTVNTLTVNSLASATAQISISPTTPVGGRTVEMITPLGASEEIVSGPLFAVTAGVASISEVGCGSQNASFTTIALAATNCVIANAGIPQGDIVTFVLQGSQTNWVQGETTFDFGSGITTSSVNVVSPTLAWCQITVSYSAALGFRQVTATTVGEVAPSFTDAVDIVPGQGTSINITPTSAPQGNTITVQVNGVATHFTANNTQATFGNNNGVNVTAVNVISQTQMNLTVQVLGTAYVGPYSLTVTTTGVLSPPETTEQLTIPNTFSVSPGAAIITKVQPTTGAQGTTANLQVTGQNTSWLTGVTTAYLSSGGCSPPTAAGVNVSNVTASSNISATVAIAIGPTAPTGFQTLCMYTLGETVAYGNAFTVTPGTPTLNSVTTPTNGNSGQQAQTITNIAITGQFTHWVQGTTVATFGQGINVVSLTINSATTATADIAIDPLAYTGSRIVTMTTGTEIVSGNLFNIIPGPAILSTINPTTGNQGQHILMTITGEFTHWSQSLTQFSITGGGYDITINGVVINSNTSAVADLTISGTANLGLRTIFMSTEGENVALSQGFVVTGGIPSIISVSPGSGTRGDNADTITITGAFTSWTSATWVDFGDPNIIVSNPTNESSTSEGMVIQILSTATLGVHTVTVHTGGQALTSQFTVLNPAAPPVPYISYMTPSVGLSNPSQTLQVYLYGSYTHWNPGPDTPITTATFGAGIEVNSFQVTGTTSATANITVLPTATTGPRTVTLTTGAEVETTTFNVTVGTPVISLVDPSTAIQGETRDIDLVGQYTTWQQGVTQFAFCPGIQVNLTTVFGSNAARVNITVPNLQPLGGCGVTATTNVEVAQNISSFSITAGEAIITSVAPNTAMQGTQSFVINVTGFATHWTNSTVFSFNGGGVSIANAVVNTPTSATLTLDLAPLATPGFYSLTATTGGEIAQMNNAFVVQPGTPVLLSSIPGSFEQQGQFTIGILGQFTSFVSGWPAAGATSVQFSGLGATITGINVTGPQSITVTGSVSALAYPGCFNIVVTTGAQVLTLYNAFCITYGPAAISNLNPNTGGTGATGLSIAITGANTNWQSGLTQANFGPGIGGTLQINSPTSATAVVTIAANATPELNTFTLTTAGEVASINGFTIFAASPILDIVSPNSGAQNTTTTQVNVTGSFTHFDVTNSGLTTADFGPNITGAVNVTSPTTATVTLNISPIAALTTRTVRMLTCPNVACATQEVAVKANAFTVTAGNASISAATPTAPVTVHQNDSGDQITITGLNTHFTQAAIGNSNVVFCSGVSTAAVVVQNDTTIFATVNVSQTAPVGACGVTVTTGGEVATGSNLFNILAGLAKITQISPNTAHQGDQNVQITVTALYTNFTSGALTISIPGATLVGSVTANSNTSATGTFNFSSTATTGVESISVSDTTDGALNFANSFTVLAGVPALISVAPNTQGQGVMQTVTLTGAFTHFSSSSVVTISGTLVSAGTVVAATATNTSIQVPITVQAGAAAGARTITVTTGAEQVSLLSGAAGAFTVQAGVPNITTITPNIGVPNSNVPVTITGIFTNWSTGSGTALSLSPAAPGITLQVTNISATSINVNFIIGAGVTAQPYTVIVTTGPQILQATNGFTVQSSTTTPPAVTFVSPTNGATGVPINTVATLTFSEPLNPTTVPTNGANAFLVNSSVSGCNASSGIAGTVAMDISGRVMTITPTTQPLLVDTTYYVELNNTTLPGGTAVIADQSGNALPRQCLSFTTGLTQDNSGPTFISANIAAGAMNIPTNTPTLILGFNKAIDPGTQAAGLAVTTSGNPVSGVWSYNSTFTQSIFTPTSAFTANTTYLVTYNGSLQGTTGLALTNPGNFSFQTAAGPDNTGGQYYTWTPPYRSSYTPTTGTNPTIRFIYNKPINPLTVTPANFYVYNTVNSATVLGASVSWSADYKTFTLTLPGQLNPGTQYRWVLNGATDWLGNGVQGGSVYFLTSTGPDNNTPVVQTVSPSSSINCGANPCAPVNAEVEVQFSELMDPTSLNSNTVTLTPTSPPGAPVTGNFSFSADNSCTSRPDSSNNCNFSLLTFTPSASLAANTTYTLSIPTGGLQDLSGNFDPFSSSFTTGSSSTPDTTHGTTSVTPASGASNIPTNTHIVVQLSKPVDPLTVNSTSVYVFDNTPSPNIVLPGVINISPNYQTLTFVPNVPFEPNHRICAYVSNEQYLFDLAGNNFGSSTPCFTIGTGSDNTAPTVISVSPTNGQSGIGPSNPVIVTFSKPMNVGTFTNNVAIYTGSTLYTQNFNYSADGTMLLFSSGTLPWNTTFTVAVNPAVADLAGNQLGAEFSSTFTTPVQPVITPPSVTTMRPANAATNVSTSAPISFFMSAPMNPATVNSSTLVVAQNGTVIPGAIAFSAGNQDITFTPSVPFTGGALIQVFITSGATDANGNPISTFTSQFSIAANVVGVAPTVLSCQNGCTTDETGVIEYLFSKPLNPATINGSTFFVKNGSNNALLAGTTSLLDGGRLLRFKPSTPFTSGQCYAAFAYLTTGIQDTTGLSFAGNNSSYYGYWCANSVSNSTAPTVSAIAPTTGATGIGTNALVSVTFGAAVDQNTLDPSNVTLTGPSGNIPLNISYNTSTFVMTVTPEAPLPPSSSITLTLNGVTDPDADALNPTPYTMSFTTGAGPDFTPPVFLSSNIASSQTNVPVTSSVTVTFNKPIDMRSLIYANTVYLQDATEGFVTLPVTLTPVGSTGFQITPSAPLSVGHEFRVYFTSIADLNGNVAGTTQIYFYTVLATLSGGPVVTGIIPLNGSNPPVNFSPMVQFDRPVASTSLSGVTLTQSGNPVAAAAQLSAGNTVLTLAPKSILSPNLPYTFTVTGVQDSNGDVMTGSVSRSFTTGSGIELTTPVVTIGSPIVNQPATETTGLNPEILIKFSEQINPITSNSFQFYEVNTGVSVEGAALSWAADYKSVQITYPGSLSPGSRYYFYMSSVCNLAANCASTGGQYFYTGTATDMSPETVSSINPPSAAGGVPINPAITLVMTKPVAPGTVSNSSITLTPAVAGTTVGVSTNGYTLTLSLGGTNLQPSTLYTVGIAAGAFTDQDGNAVSAFSSTFTTGTSAEASGFHGTISMTSPAPGTAGAALNTAITATFTQPLNPNSLTGNYFFVFANGNTNLPIAGTITNPTATTLVFTPAGSLPPNATINIYVGYYNNVTDYAGNTFNYLTGISGQFTTANTTDSTTPQVISMSPGVNAANVGPYAPVSVTFNESINVNTITSANFALYNGTTLLSASLSYSSDHRTVTLAPGALPYASTLLLAVNTGVQDVAGNNMTAAYTASFTTLPAATDSAPSVIQARPGNGAPLNAPVTLFMSSPMNLSSVQAGMYVAQNGALIPGTVTLSADLRGITWTPQSSYAQGALIEVYLTSTATDNLGNGATAYKTSFTTVSTPAAPTEVSVYPSRYDTVIETSNTVVEVLFSKPLNPATVNSTTFKVTQGSSPGGTAIPGTISLLEGNTLARFTPASPYFPLSAYFYVTLTTGIQDPSGNAFAGDGFYMYMQGTAVVDNTPPAVQAVTPVNLSTEIGDNAPVRLLFNKLIDTNTINSSTVQLSSGGQLPYTVAFTAVNSSTVATLTPITPLPDSSTITVQVTAGVTDETGTAITALSTTFGTMAGADFSAPTVIEQSIDSHNNTNVPTNATFTWVFNKPLDPSTVSNTATGGFYVYDSGYSPCCYRPVTVHVSPDGRTVSIVPNSQLSASGTNDHYYANNATDLNGNAEVNAQQVFTTAATTNFTGPTIVATNPLSTNTSPVPTNTMIEVVFSAPVSGTSLGSITLTGGANGPYTTVLNSAYYTDDTVIRIIPQSLLLPNTTYTVNVTGVTDVAGNAAGTTTFSFTTGPNFQTTGMNESLDVATITVGTGTVVSLPPSTTISNVQDTPTITIAYDHQVDYAALLHGAIALRNSSNTVITTPALNFQLSADQKTVMITTSAPLASGTTYRISSGYSSTTYDIAGNANTSDEDYTFTTQ